jgi:hypothetical protein
MGIIILLAVVFVLLAVGVLVLIVVLLQRQKTERLGNRSRDSLTRRERAAWATAVVAHAAGGLPGEGAAQARMQLTLDVLPAGGAIPCYCSLACGHRICGFRFAGKPDTNQDRR